MTKRFWKLVYRLHLRRRYEDIDRLHYLKRLGSGKQKNDMWYYSHRDADQHDGDEVVIHSRFRGKSVFFYCNPKIHVEREIIRHGLYERHFLDLIADLLEPRANTIFIDVGANIGAVTIPLAKTFPDAEVHAFEPNPLAVERLQRNLVLNKTTNVVLHPVGVGANPGRERLYTASCFEIGNSSFLKPAGSADENKSTAIEVETLDNCFCVSTSKVNGRVGLIKIDVQGYEREVLNGATALVLRDRPYIVFEHQDENFTSLEEARDAKHWLLRFFRDNRYTVFYQTHHDPSMMFLVKWDRPLNGNLLAIPTTP